MVMKELKLIKEIEGIAGNPGKGVKLGIGDDCAVIECDRKSYLLWASDMLIEGTHFNLKDAGYQRTGRKAVAVNISDIASMGGVPEYITVSVGLPAEGSLKAIRALYSGIKKICREYGISIVGGDVNRSKKLVIDVSIFGKVEKKRLITRSGAKEGDLILVTGPVRNGRKDHLDFVPRLKEARFLSGNYRISSMIDTSDGIAADLNRICASSRTGCRIYGDAVPLSEGSSFEDALYYGESFELLFTMSPLEARKLFKDIGRKRLELVYFVIGEMRSKKEGCKLIGKEGRVSILKMQGYKHF